jgi:hypothetical protein
VSIHLDADGDPALTGKADTLTTAQYSFVHDIDHPPERTDIPHQVTVFCPRGHELQINLPAVIAELRSMDPPRRVRRPISG